MADPVALTSVVTSGLVALGGVALAFRTLRDQRRHDERLAYLERSWQSRSTGLFEVVAACRALIDAIDTPGNIDAVEAFDQERGDYQASVREHVGVSVIGVRVGEVVERLQELVPVVEVYGSAACREALDELRRLLRHSGYDPRASDRLEAVRRGKAAAVDAKDYRSAATARRLEREVLEDARARLSLDLPRARAEAQRLIDAARESLRGEHGA